MARMHHMNTPLIGVGLLIGLSVVSTASALDVVWDDSRTPYAGVEIKRGHTDSPRRDFWATYVDLCADYVHVDATSPASSRRTTGQWASSQGMQVAVNGDFFEYSTPPSVYGDAVGSGMRWPSSQTGIDNTGSWYYRKYGWIAVGDGWVEFTHSENTKKNAAAYQAAGYSVDAGFQPQTVAPPPPTGTVALVSGFPELVIEGKVRTCPDPAGSADCFADRGDMRDRHLRTAMGITEDRQTLIFINTTSAVYGSELAQIIYRAGAWQAFNIDGGGSTTLWTEADGYIHPAGSVRAVANHWGVYAGAASGMARQPGSCMQPGGCAARPVDGTDDSAFADYRTDWLGYDAARVLYDDGALNACGQDQKPLLCPACVMTRGEFAYSVARVTGLPLQAPATPSFDDVPSSHPYYAEIEAFAAAGITNGCGERTFCPDDPLKRAHAAAFLSRAAGWTFCEPSSPTFQDVGMDHTFYEGIEMLAAHCVTNGCSATEFCPDRELTRQEAALFVARTFDVRGANRCLDLCEEGGIGGVDTDCDGQVDECMTSVDPGDDLVDDSDNPEDPENPLDPTDDSGADMGHTPASGDSGFDGTDPSGGVDVATSDGCSSVEAAPSLGGVALFLVMLGFRRRRET